MHFLPEQRRPHTQSQVKHEVAENSLSHLVTLKAEGYKELEMNENTTVYPEQNTQLLGRQMLHPNHIHWELGSFMHCGTVTLFSFFSNFFPATCTQAMGKSPRHSCCLYMQCWGPLGQTVRTLFQ